MPNGPVPLLELITKPRMAPTLLQPVTGDIETSAVWVSNLDVEVDPVKVVVNKKNDDRILAL